MKTLLVIDDSKFIAKEIESIVCELGYEVVGHAKNGEDGITMYDELRPDVVTLDIIMPGIDGIETATELRKINPNVKIIILSSLYDRDTIEEINEIGVQHIISKPIEADQLYEVLTEIENEQ